MLKRDYNPVSPIGAWRSPVAHLHGVQGVGGSNPLAPTKQKTPEMESFVLKLYFMHVILSDSEESLRSC